MNVNLAAPITEAIIGDAIAIHREMGPGLLESTSKRASPRCSCVVG